MNAKKYFPIALFIGIQAAVLQIIDQSICAGIAPLAAGGGWIAFQSWAVYFMGGGTIKNGIRALIGYVLGMIASIAIIYSGGQLGNLGFWAMPAVLLVLVPIILYLDIAPEMLNFVPAVFVGAGAFFGIMSYIPGATFTNAFISEGIYCVIGLIFGWMTVTFRGWYEAKYVKQ